MKYRRFGKSDWQVSEIGLGGSWFYGRPEYGIKPVSYGVAIVERALELGINYFDTAPLYGKGRSEEVLGHALKGVEQPYYLATKVGYFPEPFDYTRDTVLRGFEASLKRLQRDRVDLVQIHESEQAGWDGVFGAGRTLEALLELKEQGLTTHIGLTGSDLPLMTRILDEADDFTSVITFLKYDMLVQDAKQDLIPSAARNDAALICASPLHGGPPRIQARPLARGRPFLPSTTSGRNESRPSWHVTTSTLSMPACATCSPMMVSACFCRVSTASRNWKPPSPLPLRDHCPLRSSTKSTPPDLPPA